MRRDKERHKSNGYLSPKIKSNFHFTSVEPQEVSRGKEKQKQKKTHTAMIISYFYPVLLHVKIK